jgi:hypothetical protein
MLPPVVCPECAGRERRLLSPGFYECTSQKLIGEKLIGVVPPGQAGAGPAGVPVYEPEYVVCGFRYQEGTASIGGPQCACGMYAVGTCVICSVPVCGQHANMLNNRVLCPEHAREEAKAEAERKRIAAERAETDRLRRKAEREQATTDWEADVVRALQAIPDRTERLIRAVTEIGTAQTSELQSLISHSWNDQEIASWFVGAVRSAPPEVLLWEQRVFGDKQRRKHGWPFQSAMDRPGPHGTTRQGEIVVMPDGHIRYGHQGGYDLGPRPGERFSEAALREMTRLVGLKPLGILRRPLTGRAADDAEWAQTQTPKKHATLQEILDSRGLSVQKF